MFIFHLSMLMADLNSTIKMSENFLCGWKILMLSPRIRYGLELFQLALPVALSTPLIEHVTRLSINRILEMLLVCTILTGDNKVNKEKKVVIDT